jgi:hypothetical protein
MNMEQRLINLQNVYAASIAETVNTYERLGQLTAIETRREAKQAQSAPYMVKQLGISSINEVFITLSDIFGCANWHTECTEEGMIASATTCKLCALSKKMGGASPCKGWCLDPMIAMLKVIAEKEGASVSVEVEGTLMEHDACHLVVTLHPQT